MSLVVSHDASNDCAAESRDLPGRSHKRADSEPGAGCRPCTVPGRQHGRRARHNHPEQPRARAALPHASLIVAGAQRITKVSSNAQRTSLTLAGAQRISQVSRGAFQRAPPAPGARAFGILNAPWGRKAPVPSMAGWK